jgi:hypothetical protein
MNMHMIRDKDNDTVTITILYSETLAIGSGSSQVAKIFFQPIVVYFGFRYKYQRYDSDIESSVD